MNLRETLELANSLLDGLTADTRQISRAVATLENLRRADSLARWGNQQETHLRQCQATLAAVLTRYRITQKTT